MIRTCAIAIAATIGVLAFAPARRVVARACRAYAAKIDPDAVPPAAPISVASSITTDAGATSLPLTTSVTGRLLVSCTTSAPADNRAIDQRVYLNATAPDMSGLLCWPERSRARSAPTQPTMTTGNVTVDLPTPAKPKHMVMEWDPRDAFVVDDLQTLFATDFWRNGSSEERHYCPLNTPYDGTYTCYPRGGRLVEKLPETERGTP